MSPEYIELTVNDASFPDQHKEIHGFLNLSKLSIELMIHYSAHSQYDKRFVAMYRFDC